MSHLGVREAKRGDAGRDVRLVASPVSRLLGGRPVVAQAICLDDEAKLRPIEVDPVAVDDDLSEGFVKPGTTSDWQELLLKLRVCEGEVVAVEKVAQSGDAGHPT